MRARGFTKGEVTLSVGVVAILAMLLVPCSATIRTRAEQAKQTACVSNLRALGLAYLIYAEEWDRRTVPGFGKDKRPWCQKLDQYARDSHVFECPNLETTCTYEKMRYPIGYGLNDCLSTGVDLDTVLQPCQLITIGDDADDHTKVKGWYFMMNWDTRAVDNSSPPADRHEGGANMAFADGHTKWFKAEDIGFRDGMKHGAPPGVDYWHPLTAPETQ